MCLECIRMRGIAVFKCEDELMAGAIERAHATIIFDPNDHVFKLVIDGMTSFQKFLHMAPVHADEVD